MPSDRKPSIDQVLTNVPRGFGSRARCVSRSAMWMPLTPTSRMSRAQPTRSPGPARMACLLLAYRVAEGVIGARLGRHGRIEVEAGPRLDDGVDVGDAELAAEAHQVERGHIHRQVDAEAPPVAASEERLQLLPVALARHRLLHEADGLLFRSE